MYFQSVCWGNIGLGFPQSYPLRANPKQHINSAVSPSENNNHLTYMFAPGLCGADIFQLALLIADHQYHGHLTFLLLFHGQILCPYAKIEALKSQCHLVKALK